MFVSVFNDVLGPVMRGPSSSHTAGSYHIGRVARDLLGSEPRRIKAIFDPHGSYGRTYEQQGVDQAFVTGLMGWELTGELFLCALETARKQGVQIDFELQPILHADHPNYVILDIEGEEGTRLTMEAKSVGGGTFLIVRVNGCPWGIDGKRHELLIETDNDSIDRLTALLTENLDGANVEVQQASGGRTHLRISTDSEITTESLTFLGKDVDCRRAGPVYYTCKEGPPFSSGHEMTRFAEERHCSLGEAVLAYERTVLGLSEFEAIEEMLRRYAVMKQSVADGLDDARVAMLLLKPMAGTIMGNVRSGRLAVGGIHARASAAAMAAMHTCNSRGVVCAAPTGGAAGTLPGTLTAMEEEFGIDRRMMAMMLFAAGGIGLILAIRGTFAAEVAGCQVEIGAAGAMAAAAVVEFAGGTPRQACDAAAIAFQNTMGSVCDLVQGICEIPCHTRNGIAASSAFTNADMILAGYRNPIPLDETIDAVYASGLMLPAELRCTARGGLATAPASLALPRQKRK